MHPCGRSNNRRPTGDLDEVRSPRSLRWSYTSRGFFWRTTPSKCARGFTGVREVSQVDSRWLDCNCIHREIPWSSSREWDLRGTRCTCNQIFCSASIGDTWWFDYTHPVSWGGLSIYFVQWEVAEMAAKRSFVISKTASTKYPTTSVPTNYRFKEHIASQCPTWQVNIVMPNNYDLDEPVNMEIEVESKNA